MEYYEFLEQKKTDRLTSRLKGVLNDIYTRGLVSFRDRDCLTGYSYCEVYDWDQYFECLFLSYFDSAKYARNGVEAFLETQRPNGFIPRTSGHKWLKPTQHFKPFLSQMAWLYIRDSGNSSWLTDKYYSRLVENVNHWFWYMDFDKNGLCVWNSADHSGMDNQDRRAGEQDSFAIEGVDLNCYLVRELDALALIAERLGKPEDSLGFRKRSEALKDCIRRGLWDDEDGFFYDRNERTGEKVCVKSCVSFISLWAGVATKDQAERLVKEHLLNPDEFWLDYPLATWAKSEPDYYQGRKDMECSWMGAVWIPVNYMIFHGLMDYGYKSVARELAYKTFEMVLNEDATREYYNGETGTGDGLNPFWGWSTLGYIMPLEFETEYNPSALNETAIERKLEEILTSHGL